MNVIRPSSARQATKAERGRSLRRRNTNLGSSAPSSLPKPTPNTARGAPSTKSENASPAPLANATRTAAPLICNPNAGIANPPLPVQVAALTSSNGRGCTLALVAVLRFSFGTLYAAPEPQISCRASFP
ncbi:hypothetical protein L1887_49732 [Cichorium endivia]|nr:hypothetical protein L1887_49732 [Cichorium endivia]